MTSSRHTDYQTCLAYTAFCDLHADMYLAYAQVRLGQVDAAAACVSSALNALQVTWTAALRTVRPAADAWRLLRDHATRATTCTALGHHWNLHCLLPPPQADAVLLHRCLGLGLSQTAEVMGLPHHSAFTLLCSAERALDRLPACVAPTPPCLRLTPAHPAPGSRPDVQDPLTLS